MIHQLVRENESIFSHVTLLTFLVSPQASFKSAFVVTLVAFKKKNVFVSPQVFYKSACIVTMVALVKKRVLLLILKLPTKMHS